MLFVPKKYIHPFLSSLVLVLLTSACSDLEVIPDSFTGGGGGGPDTGVPPVACFSVDRSSCTLGDCNLQFDASCSKDALTYRWDFDNDPTTTEREVQMPSFNFTEAGTYTVRLEVEDDRNRTHDTTLVVEVEALPITTFDTTDPGLGAVVGMELLSDGGMLVVGKAGSQFYVRRVNGAGDVSLDRTYSRRDGDQAFDVTQLSDGTYAIVGVTSGNLSTTDGLYLRIRPDGVVLNGPESLGSTGLFNESLSHVLELNDGSVLMVGTTTSTSSNNRNLYLARYSADLRLPFFEDEIVLPDTETPLDVIAEADGFMVVGSSLPAAGGSERGFIARFDLEGTLLAGYPRFISGNASRSLVSVSRLGADRYLIVGNAVRNDNADGMVLEVNWAGDVQTGYPLFFGNGQNEYFSDARTTADEGVIVAGRRNNDALLVKLDDEYKEGWRELQEVNNANAFLRVLAVSDGGYLVGGYRGSSLYYGKTNALGQIEE